MGLGSEFKTFVMRGNVVDLAIGVIIGGAFGAIVNSLVGDVITPLLLKPALEAAGAGTLEQWKPGGMLLGKFLSSIISFVVIAFVLFLMVKGMNSMKKKEEAAPGIPAEPTTQEKLLMEIRDALVKK
jgi:large conductance mechanosensitive channel